jgi:hypothetical protein
MDVSANRILNKNTLDQYKKVTRTYREGIQGLQSEAVTKAMAENPEDVGGFLFSAGKETPISDLYKSVASAQKLTGKSSKDILDAMRFGYLDAMINTPENMLKFAKDMEQSRSVQNTFNSLFRGTPQYDAIMSMNEAARKGLVETKALPGLNYRTAGVALNVAGPLAAIGTGYAFILSPEQQQRIKDNLGEAAVAGGAFILSQRQLAKIMLDPQGAKTIKYLSTARDKLSSPSAFTKLVVEPLANYLGGGDVAQERSMMFQPTRGEFDISNLPVK